MKNELCEAFSLGRAEFLGIVNIIEPCQRLGGEDDGGCGDGACERAASRLVDAGDCASALNEQFTLV